jgi:hypothetical protein
MASRVQGGAAARPWWHNPDLDMPVEDIATFYRDHTQKLAKIQKQKEKEKKKEARKKARKARKKARGEESDSSSDDSSSSGSEDYDSDMEPDGLDLSKELRPLAAYATRNEIMTNVFKIVNDDVMMKMVPEKFRNKPLKDIKEHLQETVQGMSRKRLNHVIQQGVDMDYSSGESDVDSEEELDKLRADQKRRQKLMQTPIQSDVVDSTEDLVVPPPEELEKMSLEDITVLREKIKMKVQQVHEEELTSQAKKMDEDEYEYQWAEQKDIAPEEDENMGPPPPPPAKEQEDSSSDEESDDESSDEEMSEIQLKLRAKALALAKAKMMAAKKAKAALQEKKEAEEAARQERLRQLQEDDDDSDVSVDRDEPMEQDKEDVEDEPSNALVATEKEHKDQEAPEFEYATGVAPGMEDVIYQSRSPEAIEEREKTTEELQEELQDDLKSRALRSMKKRKYERLKAKAQAVESSSDDDEEEADEACEKPVEDLAPAEEKVVYRSAYTDEK